jgi:hypothetical protein
MRKSSAVALLVMAFAITAMAAKIEGITTLKDFQPTGTTDKKTHKNQQYDLSFAASGQGVHLPHRGEGIIEGHRFRGGQRGEVRDRRQ